LWLREKICVPGFARVGCSELTWEWLLQKLNLSPSRNASSHQRYSCSARLFVHYDSPPPTASVLKIFTRNFDALTDTRGHFALRDSAHLDDFDSSQSRPSLPRCRRCHAATDDWQSPARKLPMADRSGRSAASREPPDGAARKVIGRTGTTRTHVDPERRHGAIQLSIHALEPPSIVRPGTAIRESHGPGVCATPVNDAYPSSSAQGTSCPAPPS
jgi:hypothetical protein